MQALRTRLLQRSAWRQGSPAHSSTSTAQSSPSNPGRQTHEWLPTPSTHWAPLRQGAELQSSMSMSQLAPPNPARHRQSYPLSRSVHEPLLAHGPLWHSFTFTHSPGDPESIFKCNPSIHCQMIRVKSINFEIKWIFFFN